jgi:hypothetical protein
MKARWGGLATCYEGERDPNWRVGRYAHSIAQPAHPGKCRREEHSSAVQSSNRLTISPTENYALHISERFCQKNRGTPMCLEHSRMEVRLSKSGRTSEFSRNVANEQYFHSGCVVQ